MKSSTFSKTKVSTKTNLNEQKSGSAATAFNEKELGGFTKMVMEKNLFEQKLQNSDKETIVHNDEDDIVNSHTKTARSNHQKSFSMLSLKSVKKSTISKERANNPFNTMNSASHSKMGSTLATSSTHSRFVSLAAEKLSEINALVDDTTPKSGSLPILLVPSVSTSAVKKKKKFNLKNKIQKTEYMFTSNLLTVQNIEAKYNSILNKPEKDRRLSKRQTMIVPEKSQFERLSNQLAVRKSEMIEAKSPSFKNRNSLNNYMIRDFAIGEHAYGESSSR